MPNLVTLRPGARGTKKLVRQYGKRLLFVRYRYMAQNRTRYKTVELIVDERDWVPRKTPNGQVSIYIDEDDEETRQCVLIHGGRRDKSRKLWYLPEYKVHLLGLEDLVVPDSIFRDDTYPPRNE